MKNIKQIIDTYTPIQITGNREVLIESCKKILEYNDILVRVRTRDLTVQVWGSGLTVNDFNSKGIFVCGKIHSVELTENR